jgi:acetyl-CoA carboxylase biotin carboxylase subunit
VFTKVLIANRGEIAVRVVRACREMGIRTVAVFSTADRDALHTRLADERVCIGPPAAEDSYLNVPAIVSAGLSLGADAVHPGYGFLAENGDFAEACERSGLVFIGPRVRNIRLMGDKPRARRIMEKAGVPVLPGSAEALADLAAVRRVAEEIGYPVLVKAAAGGGGRGMRIALGPGALESAFHSARAEGEIAFGNNQVYVERYLERARHIEVQIVGDRHRHVVELGERDCSIQWRHQKVLEEAPAVHLDGRLRRRLARAAVRAATTIGYTNVGTVEFLVDADERFYFIEMNTRIQVEHPVTEILTGIDIVRQGIRSAADLPLEIEQRAVRPAGHAIECRINAANAETHRPSPGVVRRFHAPGGIGIRVETAVASGGTIPVHYDALIAKIIAHGTTREQAIARMRTALDELVVDGVETNTALHRRILGDAEFLRGAVHTRYLEKYEHAERAAG